MRTNPQSYRRFWKQLLDRPAAYTPLHESASPSTTYRMAASTGVDRIHFLYVIKTGDAAVELVRRGYKTESKIEREYSFNRLKRNKAKIEAAFGDTLDWIPTEHTRIWRIAARLYDVGGVRNLRAEWPTTHDAMIHAMARLEAAVSPHLDEIATKLRKPSPEDTVPTFTTPYRSVDPDAKTKETEPFSVDPDVIDRGKRSHAELQEKLRTLAEAHGLEPRSPGARDPDFDVGWWQSRTTIVLVECKSTTDANEEKQLRLGLGQVLDYAHRGRRGARHVVPVLAVEAQPRSDRWLDLCGKHGVKLVWPGRFQTLFEK